MWGTSMTSHIICNVTMALFEVWEVYGEAETHSPGRSMQIAMIYTGYIHK